MRRVLVLSCSTALLIAWGCGKPSYDARLQRTLEEMKYRQRLDENLMPPPGEGPFQDLAIFVRAPKQEELARAFALGVIPAGLHDLEASFIDTGAGHSLNLLARRKTAKKAAAKGAPPTPEVARGEFTADVLAFLSSIYGVSEEIAVGKLKGETKKVNEYRRLVFATSAGNVAYTVQVYFYKKDEYDVALVFIFPTADQAKLSSKINLCLESFAVGDRARNRFAGAVGEDDVPIVPGPEVGF